VHRDSSIEAPSSVIQEVVLGADKLASVLFEDAEASAPVDSFTGAFHQGGAEVIAFVYQAHFGTVRAAVRAILSGADGETAIHEVFMRLLSKEDLRRAYRGGSFSSWLFTVAKNHAIDFARRRDREKPSGLALDPGVTHSALDEQIEARSLVRQFRERLPEQWVPVFDARFVRQLDQRTAARALGVPRTTLVYREHRIRRLLRAFLLRSEHADG
jgi:RNA polymerase sigma-70 factor (ECF subfamily)